MAGTKKGTKRAASSKKKESKSSPASSVKKTKKQKVVHPVPSAASSSSSSSKRAAADPLFPPTPTSETAAQAKQRPSSALSPPASTRKAKKPKPANRRLSVEPFFKTSPHANNEEDSSAASSDEDRDVHNKRRQSMGSSEVRSPVTKNANLSRSPMDLSEAGLGMEFRSKALHTPSSPPAKRATVQNAQLEAPPFTLKYNKPLPRPPASSTVSTAHSVSNLFSCFCLLLCNRFAHYFVPLLLF